MFVNGEVSGRASVVDTETQLNANPNPHFVIGVSRVIRRVAQDGQI
jgi:hypothetical protein